MLCDRCENNKNGICIVGRGYFYTAYPESNTICDMFSDIEKPKPVNRVDLGDSASGVPVQKPTLGCSPYYVNISARICELCEAIKRYSTEKGYVDRIRLWCREIALLTVMNDMLRQSEEKEDGHASA